jgi:very-short-patch-repair endonuclease
LSGSRAIDGRMVCHAPLHLTEDTDLEPATSIGADVIKRIQNARRDLLDLSARNRLINTPRSSSQGRKIEIVDERSEEVFRLLVRERKVMSFLPGAGEEEELETTRPELAQPEEEADNTGTPHARHTDSRLQTRLTSERLQSRLLSMYYDAQTYEEEQGVSILYLALGFLKWYESASSDKPRYSPLLLVPVDLERPSAASRFHVRYREEDVTTNLSLQAKMKGEFDINLPDVPEMEEISPAAYFQAVTQAVEEKPRWEVFDDDMVLWFFSFAKYLMYRDLDPGSWPQHAPLGSNPTLSPLLGEGFVSEPPFCGEADKIDPLIPPASMVHVTDADSSQAVVIEEVRRGRHLVVQGPPGTGKSQTITNLIAMGVNEGKRILFVAEKMAALEVVHSRLERLGLGPICLELHSHKANKKAVLEELARTLALGRPRSQAAGDRLERLQAAIERLNGHAEVMNTPMAPSGLSPYEIIGQLRSLYGHGVEPLNLGLAGLESLTHSQFFDRCRDVEDLQAQLGAIGRPQDHAWRGVTRTAPILPEELGGFLAELGEAVSSLKTIAAVAAEMAGVLGLPQSEESHLKEAHQLAQFAIRLVKGPPIDRTRIADPVWEERLHDIATLVQQGRVLAETRYHEQYRRLEALRDGIARVGLPNEHSCRGVKRAEPLPLDTLSRLSALLPEAIESLRDVLDTSRQLEESLHLDARLDASLKEIEQLSQFGRHLIEAPRMDRCQIDHPIWRSRCDQIAELVKQGQTLSATRAALVDKVADVAWQTDLATLRRQLAGHGRSFFRWFSSNYRDAIIALRGILKAEPPRKLRDRLELLDAMISVQASSRPLDEEGSLSKTGRDAFGFDWKGSQSDWAHLAKIVAWDNDCRALSLAHSHRTLFGGLEQPDLCRVLVNTLSARLGCALDRLKSLLEPIELDVAEAFGGDTILALPVRALVDRLQQWQEQPDALTDWIEYQTSRRLLELAGMGATASRIHEGRTTAEAALRDLQSDFHNDLERRVASLRGEQAEHGSLPRGRLSTDGNACGGLGCGAFGARWNGLVSDWTALEAIVNWDRECRDANFAWNHRHHLSRLDCLDGLRASLRTLVGHLNSIPGRLQKLAVSVEFDIADAFDRDSWSRIPVRDMLSRLERWQNAPEGLSKWIAYESRRKRLKAAGLAPLIDGLHDGRIAVGAAVGQFKVAYYQALARDMFRKHGRIAEFDGQTYEQWVDEFRALDLSRIEMARGEVATAHYDAIPRNTGGGEMAVVRREIEKKRRHKPIRQLFKEAGTAILAIKPVFMMSPISVAQYLEPGSLTFDLLIVDEASQVSPVDALGAIARAKQLVVVGDDKQLPPTRFFSKMVDEGTQPEDPDDALDASDLESILGLCVAQGMPQRMLRWHYRSRHHSLIAVSNREFYDKRLCVVPSPTTTTAMNGLSFRFVKGGAFDRGNTATNRVEARAIADAVLEHAKRYPMKSLGVGAFSVAQRDAIRDELELLQRQHVEQAAFFSSGRPEPFFVKNLENIQGDERDVIFISVGYAPDRSGYMAMNFGPLSAQGGERRLNVLISRARERCEVFSSITADDIDLQRATSRGAAAFKTFLRYAATGDLETPAPTGRDFDSDFERQVARALERHGYEARCQVGTAGFRIDLGVVDPNRPGRYLLGVECDGATYHSSRSARDRDRLREAVLRDRGWRIHRVWSTDWFHRPDEQTVKLIAAIEKARRDVEADEDRDTAEDVSGVTGVVADPEFERAEQPEELNAESAAWVIPYVEAQMEVPLHTPIHETGLTVLARIVTQVVETEGPIHREEVARRITSLWGLQRTGARIADAIAKAVDLCLKSDNVQADADFLSQSQQTTVPVRNRLAVKSANLKKPEMIAPSELRQAILFIVTEHVGVRRDEIPVMVGRAIGFKATSTKFKELVEKALVRVLAENKLITRDEKLFLP